MEPADFVAYLRVDGPAVLEAGSRAPSTRVPSCPEWDAQALVGHLAGAFWWVEAMVRERATDVGAFADKPEEWGALSAWYDEGLTALLTALEQVGPDELVWNWSVMGPGPARFWHRRVAHETSVHRWDIEQAVGNDHTIDAALATDGIDEYLGIVPLWLALAPRPELSGTLGLAATDVDVAYTLDLAPEHVERHHGLHEANVVVRARVSDLFLWLLGRRDSTSDAIVIEGDASVAQAWDAISFG
jgi:uncharacterized protein (TIGR03083 family)